MRRRWISSSLNVEDIESLGHSLRDLGGTGTVTMRRKEGKERYAIVELSNPGKRNAMSPKMMHEFHECVKELEAWDDGVGVVIKGDDRERFFCSGADLEFVRNSEDDASGKREQGVMMCAFMQNVLSRFQSLPLVSVACIDGGGAVGGGTEIALSSDFRVMCSKSTFRMVHTTLGLTPGWGGGSRLVRLMGRRHALHLLASAQSMHAADALSIGLVDRVHDASSASISEAFDMLNAFAAPDRRAVRDAKRLIDVADSTGAIEDALQHERRIFARRWSETVCGIRGEG